MAAERLDDDFFRAGNFIHYDSVARLVGFEDENEAVERHGFLPGLIEDAREVDDREKLFAEA